MTPTLSLVLRSSSSCCVSKTSNLDEYHKPTKTQLLLHLWNRLLLPEKSLAHFTELIQAIFFPSAWCLWLPWLHTKPRWRVCESQSDLFTKSRVWIQLSLSWTSALSLIKGTNDGPPIIMNLTAVWWHFGGVSPKAASCRGQRQRSDSAECERWVGQLQDEREF